jgi:predicted O-methyltransferase YrrM
MKRNQTFHETFIPALVKGIGAHSYLEFGTYQNATIVNVHCRKKFGVDVSPIKIPGVRWFSMMTSEFLHEKDRYGKTRAERHAPYDVVFIDASHDADDVRRDFFGIWPHVSDEGLILCHDVNPATPYDTRPGLCGNSWEFAQYLHHKGIEAVSLPYHPGLLIARKRVQWGPPDAKQKTA